MKKINKILSIIEGNMSEDMSEGSNDTITSELSKKPIHSIGYIVGKTFKEKKDETDPDNKSDIGFYYQMMIQDISESCGSENYENIKKGLLEGIKRYL